MSVRSAVRAAAPAAAIFLLAGCLLALAYYHDNKYLSPPPYGADGVLELTDADLGRPVPLVDGWLLSVDGAPAAEAFIGQYSNFSFAPGGTSAFGSAFYERELRYDGDAPERALVLLVPEVYGDFTLYVDGAVAAAGSALTAAGKRQASSNVAKPAPAFTPMTLGPASGLPSTA